MPILIITEKTSQARDLRAALGDRFGQILPAEGQSHSGRKEALGHVMISFLSGLPGLQPRDAIAGLERGDSARRPALANEFVREEPIVALEGILGIEQLGGKAHLL